MHLTCICTGLYPEEHAAAIRHTLLARGLALSGHTVELLILQPQNWGDQKKITVDDVQFTEVNSYSGKNKILKHSSFVRSVFKTKKILAKKKTAAAIHAVIFFTTDVFAIKILLPYAQKLGIKTYSERTEFPYILPDSRLKHTIALNIYLKQLHLFDGIFVINNKLEAYIKRYNKKTKKLLTVVDLSFFRPPEKPSPYPFDYICYCGTMKGTKDGVPILIEAFAKISKKFPGLKLVLIGNNRDKEQIKETLNAVSRFNIDDKVVFTGHIERASMPVLLGNARVLAVSKPDNEQNSGNFPIKIGEYLATGVPTVVTNVGEIPMFIKDGESGFLAKPGSADSFAEKLEQALSDKKAAQKIGLAGKAVAAQHFDFKKQAQEMADYITQNQ
ncbi:MAG: glycosyltransferase family 4 protein [Ferruginibacter sp.]